MARPKAIEKRDRQVNIALNSREFEQVTLRAAAVGLRVAEYARTAALGRAVAAGAVASVRPFDPLTVEAFRKIGVALTHISRQLDAAGQPSPPDLQPLLTDIRAIVARAIAP